MTCVHTLIDLGEVFSLNAEINCDLKYVILR